MVLIGSSFREGGTPKTHNNTKGLVQAFDVRTGKRLWNFNTIPRPGELGNDTWLNDSWSVNGNVGVWNQISVDEDLGLAYLPVETPTSDFYGGHRPGNNLFADSIVAVDLKTGQRKWHYQLVHHSLWNFDVSAAPILADITVNGRPVKAVLAMTKAAMMYVLDRTTGQPVWPIEERPAPKATCRAVVIPQPYPTKPPADLQGVTEDADRLHPGWCPGAAERGQAKLGPIFTPPVLSKLEGPLASFRSSGGTSWPAVPTIRKRTSRLFRRSSRFDGRLDAAAEQGIFRRQFRGGIRGSWCLARDGSGRCGADAPARGRGAAANNSAAPARGRSRQPRTARQPPPRAVVAVN